MSIIEQQRTLESFGDDMLAQEAQQPSGQYPLFLVMTEIERRRDLRNRYMVEQQAKQNLGKPTVMESRVNEMAGIPSVDPAMGQPQQPVMGGIAGYQHGGVVDDELARLLRQAQLERARIPGRLPEFSPVGLMERTGRQSTVVPTPAPGPKAVLGSRDRPPRFPAWINSLLGIKYVPPEEGENNPDLPVSWEERLPWETEEEVATSPYEAMGEHWRKTREALGLPEFGGIPDPDFSPVFAAYDEAIGGLEEARAGVGEREDVQRMRAYEESSRARAEEMAQMYEGMIEQDPTGLEAELQSMRKTPEQMQREKKALILSGLGALIGGSANLGDIPRGMKPLTDELYGLSQQQRAEDLDLATKADLLKRSREDRNLASRVAASQALEAADAIGVQNSQYIMGLVDKYDDQIKSLARDRIGLIGDQVGLRAQIDMAEAEITARYTQALADVARVTLSMGASEKPVDPVERNLAVMKVVSTVVKEMSDAGVFSGGKDAAAQEETFTNILMQAAMQLPEMMGFGEQQVDIGSIMRQFGFVR